MMKGTLEMKVIKQDQVITVLEREVETLKENLGVARLQISELMNECIQRGNYINNLSNDHSTLMRRNEQQENTLGILNGALKQATKEIELLKRKLRTINDISFDESTLLEYEDEEVEEEMDITLEAFLISIGIIE